MVKDRYRYWQPYIGNPDVDNPTLGIGNNHYFIEIVQWKWLSEKDRNYVIGNQLKLALLDYAVKLSFHKCHVR